eukprot:CAMPEP_0202912154 /NCGR_PEP_ID=MMETSP1392-20130828/56947_1 /ASSEMBLY_ACC=CAM_ASM_000868 /TAXON_ID=225041 /ORGANISM="Chlamydomonas chlamydogama, Strain SAG 11-48b" /LENGTH=139 /DNA_ID=CAMNT_0049602955 /DNA_START=50 /DNA_END=469 /DNA_ORIENTATION=+
MDRLKSSIEQNQIVYYIFAASVVQLIAAAIVCDERSECKDYEAYAVAVGAISTAFTLVQALLLVFNGGVANKIAPWLSLFLVLWWIPGAGIGTFKSPFVITGNGYFASWAAFLFSLMYFAGTGLPVLSRGTESNQVSAA